MYKLYSALILLFTMLLTGCNTWVRYSYAETADKGEQPVFWRKYSNGIKTALVFSETTDKEALAVNYDKDLHDKDDFSKVKVTFIIHNASEDEREIPLGRSLLLVLDGRNYLMKIDKASVKLPPGERYEFSFHLYFAKDLRSELVVQTHHVDPVYKSAKILTDKDTFALYPYRFDSIRLK